MAEPWQEGLTTHYSLNSFYPALTNLVGQPSPCVPLASLPQGTILWGTAPHASSSVSSIRWW